MDNLILSVFVILVIVIITAFLLARARKTRAAGENLARRQRFDYQPLQKPIVVPAPAARPDLKPQPPAPAPKTDLGTCQDLRQCLVAISGRYSLDSFTIASSDGLVIASSGGETAQEDAAYYNGDHAGTLPGSVVLLSMDHKGSKLTGIIRTAGTITGETKNCIENDTKDILDKWV